MSDKQRADALAAVIHDLKWLVTTDHESKADFIKSVKNILDADQDLLASKLHKDIYDAECRIKQLEQELAEAKAALAAQAQQRQWISVEERLPEKFVDVLVHPRPTDYICEAAWLGDAWYWSDYELNFGVITNKCVVTHWMPLPPAPEGDKE